MVSSFGQERGLQSTRTVQKFLSSLSLSWTSVLAGRAAECTSQCCFDNAPCTGHDQQAAVKYSEEDVLEKSFDMSRTFVAGQMYTTLSRGGKL